MLKKIGQLFSRFGEENIKGNALTISDIQIASAALLIHAAFVDGHAAKPGRAPGDEEGAQDGQARRAGHRAMQCGVTFGCHAHGLFGNIQRICPARIQTVRVVAFASTDVEQCFGAGGEQVALQCLH